MKYRFLVFGLVVAVGCGESSGNGAAGSGGGDGGTGGTRAPGVGGSGGSPSFPANPPLEIGPTDRPAGVTIPNDYDPEVTYPIVMVLHGAGASGAIQTLYFNLSALANEKQFVLIAPDGVANDGGRRLWNGAGCCGNPEVDDVAYLSGLVDEALETYNTDPARVYLVGHSNGGFMSFRLGCEAAPRFTAMMSLAGATWEDPEDCDPGAPALSVLVVHGTGDDTILYDGVPGFHPGAVEVAERSATTAGCDPSMTTSLGTVDYVAAVEGEETEKLAYLGCNEGLEVELWTMVDAGHIPLLGTRFPADMIDWLLAKSR